MHPDWCECVGGGRVLWRNGEMGFTLYLSFNGSSSLLCKCIWNTLLVKNIIIPFYCEVMSLMKWQILSG